MAIRPKAIALPNINNAARRGVGIEKINGMCVQFSEAERAAFWGVKFAFDPSGLLNADKAIPTKNRCAEYGRMHIPRGAMKFPDLERF